MIEHLQPYLDDSALPEQLRAVESAASGLPGDGHGVKAREALLVLHELARIDRHRRLHTTMMYVSGATTTAKPRADLGAAPGTPITLDQVESLEMRAQMVIAIDEPARLRVPRPLVATLRTIGDVVDAVLTVLSSY